MKHINWDQIPYEQINPHFRRKLAWDGDVMVARTDVEGGYVVPLHSHPNEQVTWGDERQVALSPRKQGG